MTKIIQIRNVSEKTHRKLKARAASHGMTISNYLMKLIERDLSKPTREEIFARIQSREPVRLSKTAAELIREERDGRHPSERQGAAPATISKAGFRLPPE
jgi:antitoxin FitA